MVIARTVDSARLRVGCLRLILINRGTLLPCARTFHILERSVRARVTVQQLSTFRLVVIARLDDSFEKSPLRFSILRIRRRPLLVQLIRDRGRDNCWTPRGRTTGRVIGVNRR